MTQPDHAANDHTPDTGKSDQRQPQPDGLGNQNITRPAPVDQAGKRPNQPGQRGLEDLNVTRPAPADRR